MKKGTFSFDYNVSKVHKQVLLFFRKKYPQWELFQNYTIKMNNKSLYADIYSTNPFKFIAEINGAQHYEFVKFYHASQEDFQNAQENDVIKKEWCMINRFAFIEIDGRKKFDEDEFDCVLMSTIMDNLKKDHEVD